MIRAIMPDPIKLKRLQALRTLVASGRLKPEEAKRLTIADTDGRNVSLADDEALAALDRRIAQEQAV